MAAKILLEACVFLGALCLCHGYKAGAPAKACASMYPTGHKTKPQTMAAPYNLTVNATSYKPGDTIELTLMALSPTDFFFGGFFVQARKSDCSSTDAIGTFSLESADSEMKVMKCPAGNGPYNAVSHTSSSRKTSKTFLWTNAAGGDVYFQATIVNHKATFWTGYETETVRDSVKGSTKTYASCYKDPVGAAPRLTVGAWILVGTLVSLLC